MITIITKHQQDKTLLCSRDNDEHTITYTNNGIDVDLGPEFPISNPFVIGVDGDEQETAEKYRMLVLSKLSDVYAPEWRVIEYMAMNHRIGDNIRLVCPTEHTAFAQSIKDMVEIRSLAFSIQAAYSSAISRKDKATPIRLCTPSPMLQKIAEGSQGVIEQL